MVHWTDVLGLALLLIGVVLTTVAIPTQEWTTYGGVTLGLWRLCPAQGGCSDLDDTDDLDAVRAMMLMGDIIALLGVIVLLAAFLLEAVRDITSRWTKLAVASAALLAGALVLSGVIIYTIEIHDEKETTTSKDKGYSFWIAIAALIFLFISAFVFIVCTILEERARLRLAQKTAELRERSREDYYFRKKGGYHKMNGNGRNDVVRTPEGHLINGNGKHHHNGHQNGHVPNGNANNYRRRHRSASPGYNRRDNGNVVWDRYQHQYVPRLVPVATVLPDVEYFDARYGLPLGTYQHHIDPVGPRGYVSYVGQKGGHRRSPSGGYPGVHPTDWRRHERLVGYTNNSDPYLYH